jgi:hypothetical protein
MPACPIKAPALTSLPSPVRRVSTQRGTKGKATKAHLGDELSFYYNEEARAPPPENKPVRSHLASCGARNALLPLPVVIHLAHRVPPLPHALARSSRCGLKEAKKRRPRPTPRCCLPRSCPALPAARTRNSGEQLAVASAAGWLACAGAQGVLGLTPRPLRAQRWLEAGQLVRVLWLPVFSLRLHLRAAARWRRQRRRRGGQQLGWWCCSVVAAAATPVPAGRH